MPALRAITIHQPWASLWVAGIKKNETRSWRTNHRGVLAVHAAKLSAEAIINRIGYDEAMRLNDVCLEHGLGTLNALPRGAIVGTVEVVDCWRICAISWSMAGLLDEPPMLRDDSKTRAGEPYHFTRVPAKEEALGDYSDGRWAWVAREHKALDVPIPCAGHQGLWTFLTGEEMCYAGFGGDQ